MSLRRKSCDACFRSRRKCDLSQPVCGNCARTSKHCRYAYPALDSSPSTSPDDQPNPLQVPLQTAAVHAPSGISEPDRCDDTGSLSRAQRMEARIGPWMSLLGQLEPVQEVQRWAWVYDQMREWPLVFATQAETVFIHSALREDEQFPRPLRAAFGICAATATMTEKSGPLVFRAVDAEVTELLAPQQDSSLQRDLVRLQAAVLYQTIRLFHGGVRERMIAEQQEFLLRSFALTILRRADAELQTAPKMWETWILMESIRRTVVATFKLYTMYWSFKKRHCFEIEGLDMLPVSTSPELWRSDAKKGFEGHPDPDGVVTHADFTNGWGENPTFGLEPFHEMLIWGCKRRPSEVVM